MQLALIEVTMVVFRGTDSLLRVAMACLQQYLLKLKASKIGATKSIYKGQSNVMFWADNEM